MKRSVLVPILCAAIVRGFASAAFAADASPAPSAVPSAAPTASASASPSAGSEDDPAMHALAVSLVAQAQSGKIDRSLFEPKMQSGLTQTMVDTMSAQMGRLGKPTSVTFESYAVVGAYRSYHYRVAWPAVAVDESFALDADGKIAGWYFQPTT